MAGSAAGSVTWPAAASPDSLQIDGSRMLADLLFLSSDDLGGRAAGSPGGVVARERIVSAFEEAGLQDVELQPFSFGSNGQGVNVVGLVPGTDRSAGTIAITAHYDHLGVRSGEIYNGADDNASGTAALMELARQIAASPLRHSVLIAALDAEEAGLRGARALVGDPPVPLDEILLDINMDMVSRSPAGELYASGTYHYPRLREIVEPVVAGLSVTLLFGHDVPGTGSDDWTYSSDQGPFHRAGIPFLYFGVEDHPGYHNPGDDFEDITPEFYVGAVRSIYAVIAVLDQGLSGRVAPREN
jgi:peptidase M28-like protein